MIDEDQSDKREIVSAQLNRTPLEKWILSVAPAQRDSIINANAGTSSNYVLKCIYTHRKQGMPTFKLAIAAGLDKASGGQVDFRELIEGGDQIDWAYINRVLTKRLREERKAQKSQEKLDAPGSGV